MENKFKLKFNNKINSMLYLVVAICLIGLICDIVFLTLAIKNESAFIAYIVSGTLLLLLLVLFGIIKLASYYKMTKKHFVAMIFPFKKKIDYQDILNIRHDDASNQTIMYYYTYPKNGDKLIAMMYLNVGKTDLDILVKELKNKNNLIIYDVFNAKEDTNEQD